MPIFPSKSSRNLAIPIKAILISTTVVTAAVALKLSVPAITDFAVTDAPSIYNGLVSWLRPPYLYLVINCIIITIVASSKFQSKVEDMVLTSAPATTAHLVTSPVPAQVQVHPQHVISDPAKPYNYNDFIANKEAAEAVKSEEFNYTDDSVNTEFRYYEPLNLGNRKELIDSSISHTTLLTEDETSNFTSDSAVLSKSSWSPAPTLSRGDSLEFSDEMSKYASERAVLSRSSRSPAPLSRRDSLEFSDSNEKPLVSSRFGHRRAVKASPEGGKMSLGVSKPRKQDTLESTWKTITEGRAMPLTRHLKKSDTWETHGGGGRHQIQASPPKMTKAETFHERNTGGNSLRSPSPGQGKLKKEPSLSQDELNRRVEAFIKKFNEEMRMQRQESLNQYSEMISRGAR